MGGGGGGAVSHLPLLPSLGGLISTKKIFDNPYLKILDLSNFLLRMPI